MKKTPSTLDHWNVAQLDGRPAPQERYGCAEALTTRSSDPFVRGFERGLTDAAELPLHRHPAQLGFPGGLPAALSTDQTRALVARWYAAQPETAAYLAARPCSTGPACCSEPVGASSARLQPTWTARATAFMHRHGPNIRILAGEAPLARELVHLGMIKIDPRGRWALKLPAGIAAFGGSPCLELFGPRLGLRRSAIRVLVCTRELPRGGDSLLTVGYRCRSLKPVVG